MSLDAIGSVDEQMFRILRSMHDSENQRTCNGRADDNAGSDPKEKTAETTTELQNGSP